MKSNLNTAFTLIEMLVVISLIGILAAIALVSFGGAQKQARDTTRKSDLKQYQTSLEIYGNLTNGVYPSRTEASSAYSTLCDDLNLKLEPDVSCSQDPKMSVDPDYYDYRYISNGTNGTASATNYVMWAKLEAKGENTYLIVCSNGKVGTTAIIPASSDCPALVQL